MLQILTLHLLCSQVDLDSELAAAEPVAIAPLTEAAPAAELVKTLDLGDDAGWGDDGAAAAPDADMEDRAAGEGVTDASSAALLLHRLASSHCMASSGSNSGTLQERALYAARVMQRAPQVQADMCWTMRTESTSTFCAAVLSVELRRV